MRKILFVALLLVLLGGRAISFEAVAPVSTQASNK